MYCPETSSRLRLSDSLRDQCTLTEAVSSTVHCLTMTYSPVAHVEFHLGLSMRMRLEQHIYNTALYYCRTRKAFYDILNFSALKLTAAELLHLKKLDTWLQQVYQQGLRYTESHRPRKSCMSL